MRAATPTGGLVAHIGERDGQKGAVGQRADQIAEEHPAPVDEHGAAACLAIDPRQWHQRETAGYQFEPEQHDDADADGKDERADEWLAGLHRAGQRKACRDPKNGARQNAADENVGWCQGELAPARFDHGARDVRGLYVIHKAKSPQLGCANGACTPHFKMRAIETTIDYVEIAIGYESACAAISNAACA